MAYIFLFILIHIVSTCSKELERIVCDGVIFQNVYYDKEVLFKDLGRPYSLMMHTFSGTLFFSHTVQNETHVDFVITSCVVQYKRCRNIPGIQGGYTIAYDAANDDIYFGGHDGIYKYNFLSKTADFFAEGTKSIWGIFVKKHFYYIEYPSQKLYVYKNARFVQVVQSKNVEIDCFFISKLNIIYFSNKTALYKYERPYPDVIMLEDEISVRQIVEDSYGDVYFVASDGVYVEERPHNRVKKIADIEQAFGLTFDEDETVIFSDKNAIYRLVKTKHSSLCFKALESVNEIDVNSKVNQHSPMKISMHSQPILDRLTSLSTT